MQSDEISIYTLKIIGACAKFKAVLNPFEGLSSGFSLPCQIKSPVVCDLILILVCT